MRADASDAIKIRPPVSRGSGRRLRRSPTRPQDVRFASGSLFSSPRWRHFTTRSERDQPISACWGSPVFRSRLLNDRKRPVSTFCSAKNVSGETRFCRRGDRHSERRRDTPVSGRGRHCFPCRQPRTDQFPLLYNKPITSSKAGGLNWNRSKRFGLLGPVKQAEFIQPFVFTFLIADIGADRFLVCSYG